MQLPSDWPMVLPSLALSAGRIEVFFIDLKQPTHEQAWYEASLTSKESQRAARYRIDEKRTEFAVTRGSLRRLLASLTGIEPERVPLEFGLHGKPSLKHDSIRFNVSHSHDAALIAITLDSEIGVDIEQVRPRVSYMRLAERFFSPVERDELLQLPKDDQQFGFFACWTRKEALLKADGSGIARGLDTFDVLVDPAMPAVLLETRWPDDAHAAWRLADIDVGPYYRAAIASNSTIDELRLWRV